MFFIFLQTRLHDILMCSEKNFNPITNVPITQRTSLQGVSGHLDLNLFNILFSPAALVCRLEIK